MPLSSQLHRDAALENISVAFHSGEMIAKLLAPNVPVKHESDVYHVYSRDSLILPETARANGAEANRASWSMSTATYRLDEHAIKDLVSDRSRANADAAIKLDIDLTEYLTEKVLLRQEVDLATLVTTAGNWAQATSLAAAGAWSAQTTVSNPMLNADSAATTVITNSGKKPNVCAINDPTFRALRNHVSVVERSRYVGIESVSEDMIGRMFGVESLLVGRAIQNTANEGLAETMANVWTDMAYFAYVEKSPGLKKPSALYCFTKTDAGNPYQVKKWRNEERGGDEIEVSKLFDNAAVASVCAYIIVNTVQ